MMEFWLALKLLFSKKTLGQTNSKVAIAGIVIGVGCLVVAMAVMSGYERTLRETVVDVAGHLQVYRSAPGIPDWNAVEKRIFGMESRLQESLRYVYLQAVMAHKGDTLGVTIQGVDENKWQKVLNFSNRILSGDLDIASSDGLPRVLIGKVLAQRMNLKVGDRFRVVVPVADGLDPHRFGRRLGEFQIQGILDFGKYEWNERFLITGLSATQDLTPNGRDQISGLIFRIDHSDHARDVYFNLSSQLGFGYSVRDWQDYDQNLFQATQGERVVIFFVVFIIIIVAAFSVASNFYINIFQRFPDIAILKTLCLKSSSLIKIYGIQGILLGAVGTFLGYAFGLLLCYLFFWGQKVFRLLPGSVYRLSEIQLQINWLDTLAILGSTLLICLIASIFPALRGAKLNPVEGLRYE
jgi:lipoprotein-releasing system permease protein